MQQTALGFRRQFVVNAAAVLIGVLLAITLLIKQSNSMMAPPSPNRPDAGQTPEPRLVRPLYEFGGKLLVELNKRSNGDKNVILSPVSIHLGLSMVLLGSDTSSQTKHELMNAIGYSNTSESDIKQCQENYAKIMTDFKRITSDTLKDRKEFEANKAQIKKQSPYELAYRQPRSPLLDLFTMLVTKNKAQVRADYDKEIKKYFQATIGNVDDKKPETKTHLLKTMNDWAKEAGFEKPVMSEEYLNDDFSAILLSAIRVEAFWSDDFSELEDKKVFYNYGSKDKPVGGKCLTIRDLKGSRFLEFTSGERAKVKYLHESMGKNETYNKLAKLDFRAIELPLRDGLNFVIFEPLVDDTSSASKPATSSIAKLNKLTASLFSPFDKDSSVTNLAKVLGLLDLTDNDNELDYLRMPKFKFESHIDDDLKSALGSIGIKRAFDDKHAEIRQITGEELFIKDIKHKAMIEATKTGIKAAGLTMVKMSMRSAAIGKSENIRVTLENPFLFVIRYQRIPLFVGQLTNL